MRLISTLIILSVVLLSSCSVQDEPEIGLENSENRIIINLEEAEVLLIEKFGNSSFDESQRQRYIFEAYMERRGFKFGSRSIQNGRSTNSDYTDVWVIANTIVNGVSEIIVEMGPKEDRLNAISSNRTEGPWPSLLQGITSTYFYYPMTNEWVFQPGGIRGRVIERTLSCGGNDAQSYVRTRWYPASFGRPGRIDDLVSIGCDD
ncbi:MAG: hypothetical protein AAGA64_18190 [Bacteroidota bacterium]